MLFLRVLLFVIFFTAIGLGIMFYSNLRPMVEGCYAYYQGNDAFRQGEYSTARKYYLEAVKGYPNPAEVYVKLGDAQMELNHPNAAKGSFHKALDLAPNSREALSRLAKQEWDAGHQHIALGMYQDALQADPHNASLRSDIADMYFNIARETKNPDDYRKAENVLKKYSEKDQSDETAQYKLAESLFAEGRYEDSLDLYCELTQKHPENPETLYSLAVTFAKNKDYRDAYLYMSQAVEQMELVHPEVSQKWAALAVSFQQQETMFLTDPTEAVTHCLERLKSVPKEEKDDTTDEEQ